MHTLYLRLWAWLIREKPFLNTSVFFFFVLLFACCGQIYQQGLITEIVVTCYSSPFTTTTTTLFKIWISITRLSALFIQSSTALDYHRVRFLSTLLCTFASIQYNTLLSIRHCELFTRLIFHYLAFVYRVFNFMHEAVGSFHEISRILMSIKGGFHSFLNV